MQQQLTPQQEIGSNIQSFLINPTPEQNKLFRRVLPVLVKMKRDSLKHKIQMEPLILPFGTFVYDLGTNKFLINGGVWNEKPSTLASWVQSIPIIDEPYFRNLDGYEEYLTTL